MRRVGSILPRIITVVPLQFREKSVHNLMKLIRNPFIYKMKSVVTIGNFDGFHVGHQRLLRTLIESSHDLQLPSVVVTFEPNPVEFFRPDAPMPRLMRFSEKWNFVRQFHVDYFCCLKFNAVLAHLSAEDFVKKILVDQLGAKKIIVGDDFRFGAKRSGDIDVLKMLGKEYGFTVDALSQSMYESERISSSRVRDVLKQGNFKIMPALIDRNFSLTGKVAYGAQIGRQLGFPTANIHLHRKQVPLMGIFIVRVHGLDNKIYNGVASAGYRPTFDGKQILLEVFIFDFDAVIYGKKITVEFLEKIRDEVHFDSVPELVVQIEKDVAVAKEYFKNHRHFF